MTTGSRYDRVLWYASTGLFWASVTANGGVALLSLILRQYGEVGWRLALTGAMTATIWGLHRLRAISAAHLEHARVQVQLAEAMLARIRADGGLDVEAWTERRH